MAAIAVEADEDHIMLMRNLGMKLGLAFQILDDLIDATATPEMAGKDVAQDDNSPSIVRVIGAEAASGEAQRYVREATALIDMSDAGADGLLRHFAMTLVAGLENKLKTAS